MAKAAYRVSFTTGGIYYREATKAASMYLEFKNWQVVRINILEENLFQTRTSASAGRILRELLPRLSLLTEEQLNLLVTGTRQEQNQVLWLAVCKQYQIIREFAVEVVREKMLRLDTDLSYADFDAFFNAKSEWHEELSSLTEMTRKKLRRVLFQMLRETEILSKTNQLLPIILSPRIIQLITKEDASFSAIFPISETDFIRQASL